MKPCKACDTGLDESAPSPVEGLCAPCAGKRLNCRVCGRDFLYGDIVENLPIVQCPACEGRAIDVQD